MLHRYTLGKLHTYVLYACYSHNVALNKQQAASVCFKTLIKLTLAPLSPCKWNTGLCLLFFVVVVFTKSLIHANKCLDLEAHTPPSLWFVCTKAPMDTCQGFIQREEEVTGNPPLEFENHDVIIASKIWSIIIHLMYYNWIWHFYVQNFTKM